jgi:hypothetical protein
MSAFLIAGLCLIASALIVCALDRWCRPVPLVELMRHTTNDAAIAAYETRRDALGHGACRLRNEPENRA